MAESTEKDLTLNIEADQLVEFEEAFALLDNNGDGQISARELITVLRSMGHKPTPTLDQVREMIAEYDTDGSGTIEWPEFVALMEKQRQTEDNEHDIREAFDAFDTNNTGYLTAKELKDIMKILGDDLTDMEVRYMIEEADLDGDGLISYEEFQRIMKKK